MLQLLKRKISDPIVTEVDRFPLGAEPAALIAKMAGIRDNRVYTALGKNLPREHELRIEILFLRAVIDDSNPMCGAGSRSDTYASMPAIAIRGPRRARRP